MSGSMKKVCIVVLGDIGRSPRMEYHALSFAEEGYSVELVGYSGSEPLEKLKCHPNVKFNYIYHCPDFKNYLPTVLAHAAKVIWQTFTLFIALLFTCFPQHVLVQNPPAVPALGVCYLYCKIFRSKFIIDWHNYAYTILALSLGNQHPLVRISKIFEFFFGRKADKNICVTKAMKEDLENLHGITAVTFYDRPPSIFKVVPNRQQHELFLALGIEYPLFLKDCNEGETIFTKLDQSSNAILREDRPALVISSTSWTEDEDFSILLSALEDYESCKNSEKELPKLICAITGKGPLKDFYMKIIEKRCWKNVKVITPWLEAEDYPKFLACGDLGVCLHTSSSGLDLPMKVVDMFGCTLPVCAIQFNCISELVKHQENGFVFHDSKELAQQMQTLLSGFPSQKSRLIEQFKDNLKSFNSLRWHEHWKFTIMPLFSTSQ